jgi:hypothetical protein
MCNFMSAVLTKEKLYYHLDMDSHEDIIQHFELKDTYSPGGVVRDVNLVRLELTPKDSDICNHNLDNWQLRIDQDIRPDWLDLVKAEKLMKDAVQVFFKERFAIDCEIAEIKEGFWRAFKNAKVGTMWGSSQVGTMRESSRVGEMWGSSQVGTMWESSRVGEMWGSSQVGEMRESSQVGTMWGSSQVTIVSKEAHIKTPSDKCIIISRLNNGMRIFTPFTDAKLVTNQSELY